MIHRKLRQYFEAGVLTGNAILESAMLPGFALPLEELFA
jgi:hypothetical protein